MLDCSGTNISSSSLAVTAFDLRLVGSATSATILDAGDSNPDFNFRYDSTIGTAGGYIFNLSTKDLSSGQFTLRFYVGGDMTIPYSLSFQVK
jgi:hypothetical protein